jgi:hypothetical protein
LYKFDHEPLLSAGRHEMTLQQFEEKFVLGLGGNRAKIWDALVNHIVDPIVAMDIPCELWIDGSFITKCPEPSDIDGSVMVEDAVIKSLSHDAFNYLNQIDDSGTPFDEALDIYLCHVYPKGHPLRDENNDPDGWAKQWSKEHNSTWLKGFVVIPFR